MITNTGKNIIAKYLIGDAPAYASFMALGCGPKPRNTINTLSNVDTFSYSGNLSVASTTSLISNITNTLGLIPGMTLARISGTGAFGGTSEVATIVSVNSSTSITVVSSAANTVGPIVFHPFGTYSVLQVENSSPLWTGARLSQISSFAGSLSESSVTTVDKVLSSTLIRITPGSSQSTIQDAVLGISSDPRINTLEFESIRVPISSRGYVNDNGTNKIILTAQLPSEERYEFTEIGIYSAGSNRSAGAYDSKTISAFSATEGWQLNANNAVSGPSTTNAAFLESDVSIINTNNNIVPTAPAIKIRATNGIFANQARIDRYERTRYLDNVFLLRGNNCLVYNSGQTELNIDTENRKFLQLSSSVIDLSKNSSSDLLKLAFSIVSVNGGSSEIVPEDTFIIVEFSNNNDTAQYAKMQITINKNDYDLAQNRYIVATQKLEDLFYTSQFSWKTANTIKVYASTTTDINISNKLAGAGVATLTTSAAHGLQVGNRVFISGVSSGNQDLNGLKVVTGTPTPTKFTYASTSTIGVEVETPGGKAKVASDKFYIALDALRVDNINTVNPLYGLVGYSIIQDELEQSIVKSPNTTNFIEYRFVLDVT